MQCSAAPRGAARTHYLGQAVTGSVLSSIAVSVVSKHAECHIKPCRVEIKQSVLVWHASCSPSIVTSHHTNTGPAASACVHTLWLGDVGFNFTARSQQWHVVDAIVVGFNFTARSQQWHEETQ